MKNTEADYLNKLFATTSDDVDGNETDFPLVDAPEGLAERLYGIPKATKNTSASTKHQKFTWPKLASVAASLLMAVVLVQVYQQQQTLKQLEQAQADLATALHYLGEANAITKAQVLSSLKQNRQSIGITPAVQENEQQIQNDTDTSAEEKPSGTFTL